MTTLHHTIAVCHHHSPGVAELETVRDKLDYTTEMDKIGWRGINPALGPDRYECTIVTMYDLLMMPKY